MSTSLISELILPQISLKDLTSYRVGGNAQWYAAPGSHFELASVLSWFETQKIPLTVIGTGSNLLVSDRGLEGLVISTRHLRGYDFHETTAQITASGGDPIARLAWLAAKKGWSGLEWAVGIPGTVGGAVVMNAGAHARCTADCLISAKVISFAGEITTISNQDLNYSYRTSKLQKEGGLVIEATFQLQPQANQGEVKASTNQYLQHRQTTQPYDKPSCGSVFRNPSNYAAGWLIEQTGLKGYRHGGAQVSERHANFIVNCGSATAKDIFELIIYVTQQVKASWDITLEPEVKMLGEF